MFQMQVDTIRLGFRRMIDMRIPGRKKFLLTVVK